MKVRPACIKPEDAVELVELLEFLDQWFASDPSLAAALDRFVGGGYEAEELRAGRQRFCSTTCRQTAWRRRRLAPVEPVVTRSDTVYQCPDCEARYLGDQRCDGCNTWCRRVGPGGMCPCCEEPVAIADLVTAEQFAPRPARPTRRR